MAKAKPTATSDMLAEPLRWATQRALNDIAMEWAADGHVLAAYLAALVAELVRPGQAWGQVLTVEQMQTIRNGIDPEIIAGAIAEAFDAEGYFGGSPVAVAIAALTDIKGGKGFTMPTKTADIKSMAIAEARRTGWLPAQMRTPAYDGPHFRALKKKDND